jgi:GNAT superfamily N-acetyltransferase
MLGLDLIRHTRETSGDLAKIATDIHTEVYSEPLFGNHQFFSQDAFRQRYEIALKQPAFELVMAIRNGKEIGYVYGFSLSPEMHWWDTIQWAGNMEPNQPANYTTEDGCRTAAIAEILVRLPWRRMGVARALHDLFISHRREQRAGLLVLPNNFPAKAAYFKWGWNTIGTVQPAPTAPLFECMVKPLR